MVGGWERYPTEKTILRIWLAYYVRHRQVLINGLTVNWESGKSHMTITGLHRTWPPNAV